MGFTVVVGDCDSLLPYEQIRERLFRCGECPADDRVSRSVGCLGHVCVGKKYKRSDEAQDCEQCECLEVKGCSSVTLEGHSAFYAASYRAGMLSMLKAVTDSLTDRRTNPGLTTTKRGEK